MVVFVYHMLGLPSELFTLYSLWRVSQAGARTCWRSRSNVGKIIRPAYKSISEHRKYVPLEER